MLLRGGRALGTFSKIFLCTLIKKKKHLKIKIQYPQLENN